MFPRLKKLLDALTNRDPAAPPKPADPNAPVDPNAPPAPAPVPASTLASVIRWLPVALKYLPWLFAVVMALVMAFRTGKAPEIPPIPLQPQPSFGWLGEEAEEQAIRAAKVPEFADTEAAAKNFGPTPAEAFLWQAVEKCWAAYPGRDARPYPQIDQGPVGWCVGAGTGQGGNCSLASEILFRGGNPASWKPLSGEAIYGASRMIGNDLNYGDGSRGPWSAKACTDLGFAPMERIGSTDLSKVSAARAKEYGARGVPKEVLIEMAKHKVAQVARIRSYDELTTALSQGYGCFICSNLGFESRNGRGQPWKDKDGFQQPNGSWPHCMAPIGFQSDRPGCLIQNSWDGRYFHTGPQGKGNPPTCSFWVDKAVAEKWIASPQTYCYAISGIAGFESRDPAKIDWLIRGNVPAQPEVFVSDRSSHKLRSLRCSDPLFCSGF